MITNCCIRSLAKAAAATTAAAATATTLHADFVRDAHTVFFYFNKMQPAHAPCVLHARGATQQIDIFYAEVAFEREEQMYAKEKSGSGQGRAWIRWLLSVPNASVPR